MLRFAPQVSRINEVIEFPQPILVCRILDAWNYDKMKVPLRDGDHLTGHSRQGVDIVIEGQIGKHQGELRLSEPEMLQTLESIREALHVGGTSDPYSLVLFHDPDALTSRYFQNCTTTRFEFDLSNQHLYSYTTTIHAADPTLYDSLV